MKAIVNVSNNWGIGKDNQLLCHIPEDMKFFKEITMNKAIIYGRKTLESFPGYKPLPHRTNILLSSSKDNVPETAKQYCDYYAYINHKDFHGKDIGITGITFNHLSKETKPDQLKTTLVLINDISIAEEVGMFLGHCTDDIFVIGGESIYRQLLPLCDSVYVTKSDIEKEADSYFPNLDEDKDWRKYMESEEYTSSNGIRYKFVEYHKP